MVIRTTVQQVTIYHSEISVPRTFSPSIVIPCPVQAVARVVGVCEGLGAPQGGSGESKGFHVRV